MSGLDAQLVARALVAAARARGFPPVRLLEAGIAHGRRASLLGAAQALMRHTGCTARVAARLCAIHHDETDLRRALSPSACAARAPDLAFEGALAALALLAAPPPPAAAPVAPPRPRPERRAVPDWMVPRRPRHDDPPLPDLIPEQTPARIEEDRAARALRRQQWAERGTARRRGKIDPLLSSRDVDADLRAQIDRLVEAGAVTRVPDGHAAGTSALEEQFWTAAAPRGDVGKGGRP
jgi:hypothetical protein